MLLIFLIVFVQKLFRDVCLSVVVDETLVLVEAVVCITLFTLFIFLSQKLCLEVVSSVVVEMEAVNEEDMLDEVVVLVVLFILLVFLSQKLLLEVVSPVFVVEINVDDEAVVLVGLSAF